MFDGRYRKGVERGLGPLGGQLRRVGVTADHVTAAGLAVSDQCDVADLFRRKALHGTMPPIVVR